MIGFSGGGDSLALLMDCARQGPVHAVIVDHALREESREAALAAARLAAQHGAVAEIVRLDWAQRPKSQAPKSQAPKSQAPKSQAPKSQAAWRRARLAALCAVARRLGVDRIALGHTQDDQAETLALRIAAGSGWRGLAGMSANAPAPIWPEGRGLLVLRPLLEASRAELRGRLRAAGADWIEDPANENPRFARIRARARLAQSPRLRAGLLRLAALAARAANALDRQVWGVIAGEIAVDGGVISLRRACAQTLPAAVQRRLMACLLTAVSGRETICTEEMAARSLHRLRLGESHTLFGVSVRCLGTEIVLERDPGAVLGRGRNRHPVTETLFPGMAQVWDNRLECRAETPGWRIAPGLGGCPRMIHARLAPLGLGIGEKAAPAAHWLIEGRLRALLWRALL